MHAFRPSPENLIEVRIMLPNLHSCFRPSAILRLLPLEDRIVPSVLWVDDDRAEKRNADYTSIQKQSTTLRLGTRSWSHRASTRNRSQ